MPSSILDCRNLEHFIWQLIKADTCVTFLYMMPGTIWYFTWHTGISFWHWGFITVTSHLSLANGRVLDPLAPGICHSLSGIIYLASLLRCPDTWTWCVSLLQVHVFCGEGCFYELLVEPMEGSAEK